MEQEDRAAAGIIRKRRVKGNKSEQQHGVIRERRVKGNKSEQRYGVIRERRVKGNKAEQQGIQRDKRVRGIRRQSSSRGIP